MKKGLVSVIIPTYRRSETLGRSINSVLKQTYTNIEIIVVDDNNENDKYRIDTEKFMNQYSQVDNLKYIKHKKNSNGSVARNTGLKYSQGEYICFLDDDDEFDSKKIEKQVKCMKKLNDEYGATYCGFNIIRGDKLLSTSNPNKQGNLFKELISMDWGTGSGSNVMFKSHVLSELKGFDEKLKRHQDWDVLLRMFRKYKITLVEEPLLNIYKDSRINIPNANEFVEVKTYFLSKFKEDIENMYMYDRQRIYKKHSLELSIAFLKNKEYKNAFKYFNISNECIKVDFREKIGLFLIIIYTYMPFKEQILVSFSNIIDKFRIVRD